MRAGSQPSDAVHSSESMWSGHVRSAPVQPPSHAPEKLRPKTSSSGGSKALGLVVLVMESLEGSMSLIVVPTEASAWMLYGRWLRHRNEALRQVAAGRAAGRAERWDSEESNRNDRC